MSEGVQPDPWAWDMKCSFYERGGLWVIAQAVLMAAVILLAALYHGPWDSLFLTMAGGALLALGGAVGLAGALALARNLTPFPKPPGDGPLVQDGIYALVRHPLYSAVMAASVGWALLWQSWPALLVALATGPFFAAKARREEEWLCEKFPEYAAYAKRVRRFIPWIY
jgi:protein-S-isoprenylcysteine O-methyltransferase Ste14